MGIDEFATQGKNKFSEQKLFQTIIFYLILVFQYSLKANEMLLTFRSITIIILYIQKREKKEGMWIWHFIFLLPSGECRYMQLYCTYFLD